MNIDKWLEDAIAEIKSSDPCVIMSRMDKHGLLYWPEEWIVWEGGAEFPDLSPEHFVQVELRDGQKDQGMVKDFRWKHSGKSWSLDVVKYRG